MIHHYSVLHQQNRLTPYDKIPDSINPLFFVLGLTYAVFKFCQQFSLYFARFSANCV